MTIYIDARRHTPTSWIPGAHRADLDVHLSAPNDPRHGGRHPLPDLGVWCATLGSWGVQEHSDVVVYDSKNGGLAAARAWWMLRAVGHERVRVCDLSECTAERSDVVTPLVDGPAYPATRWSQPMATADEVEGRRADADWRLIDSRSAVRFRGEHEVLDPVAGHIPGAFNMPWEETVDLDLARERLDRILGDTPMERVILQCGSGVTACHALLQLHRMGRDGAALYVGSWSEWCRQGRPMEP